MIRVIVPGGPELALQYLVLDYNGTLARDGVLLAGVRERLMALASELEIHIVTADTFGTARAELEGVSCRVNILAEAGQDVAKAEYVRKLGPKSSVCIGNGRNDRGMVRAAALGIAVVQQEGAAVETLLGADVVVVDVRAALDLLLGPARLIATLRI